MDHLPTEAFPVTIFLSDPALDELVKRAIETGHVKANSQYLRGMSQFIEAVMQAELQDSRPPEIREEDEARRQAGLAPQWFLYQPRLKRKIKATSNTLIQACAHAYTLGISSTENLRDAPEPFEGPRCLSILLEAIGTEWITYEFPPTT